MDRSLLIPEILAVIIGYVDYRAQMSCALVCKDWSNVALDALWKELESPKPLLSLLAPLCWKSHRELYLEFERPIRLEDWAAFNRYAPRVRSLTLDFKELPISPGVFFEMGQKRPSFTVLPNLTYLDFRPDKSEELACPLLFMSESVRKLSFRVPAVEIVYNLSDESVSEFFKEASVRLPKIKGFELLTASHIWSILGIQEHVVNFLSSLKELKTFRCSPYFTTSDIASALSQLPELRVVTFEDSDGFAVGIRKDVINFRPSISPGAFPALVDLSFSAIFSDASKFLELDFAPILSMLGIHSPEPETEQSMHQLLSVLSRRRPLLTELVLIAIADGVREPVRDEAGHEIDNIKLETILPLLDFPNLVYICITYHRPFHLSNMDLQQFLMKLRELEVLVLCSDPLLRETPSLTSDVLPIIADCCPKLRLLSLYLDTHVTNPSPAVDAVSPTRFASLESIEFGTSPLIEADIPSFVSYLSELLPSTFRTESLCDICWFIDKKLIDDGFRIDDRFRERWDKACWALNILIEAREQDRNRIRELEREVKEARDLSMRVASLEEQLRLALSAIGEKSENGRVCVH